MPKSIAVIGAGAWGTALAQAFARAGHRILLWGRERDNVEVMHSQRENKQFLPGITLDDNIVPTPELTDALSEAELILLAAPSHVFGAQLAEMQAHMPAGVPLMWATKGLAAESAQLLHQVAHAQLGDAHPLVVISGPSFAKETAEAVPTAVSLACADLALAKRLASTLSSDTFQLDPSDDVVGVQLGGVVKNVIAIVVGMADGLALGANTRCALITRGLGEMSALGQALGARAETFQGLSGVGDLVLTCTDNQSRNRRFGLALGEGQSVQQAQETVGALVEGATNATILLKLAQSKGVAMPMVAGLCEVLAGKLDARAAIIASL